MDVEFHCNQSVYINLKDDDHKTKQSEVYSSSVIFRRLHSSLRKVHDILNGHKIIKAPTLHIELKNVLQGVSTDFGIFWSMIRKEVEDKRKRPHHSSM